jgi:hypothetical protein
MTIPPLSSGRLALLAAVLVTAAACERRVSGPAPVATAVDPQVMCTDQLSYTLSLTGSGFSPAPQDALLDERRLALPKVTLVGEDGEVVLNEDTTTAQAGRVSWVSQEQLRLSLDPELGLGAGVYSVRVDNPTGGKGTLSNAFAIAPPPQVTAVEPEPACTAQYENTLTVRGAGFLKVAGALPTVRIGDLTLTATAAGACETLAGPRGDVERCGELTVVVAQGALPEGAHAVSVTNPAPADCVSSEQVVFHVVPPPQVTAVAPSPLCNAQGTVEVAVTGEGFLRIAGTGPTLRLGAYEATDAALDDTTCAPVEGLAGVQRCTRMTATVPDVSSLPVGAHAVVVTNPEPAQCSSNEDVTLAVVPPPTVTGISPQTACSGGGSFTLTGENLESVSATLTDSSGGVVTASNVSVAPGGQSAQVTFGAGLKPETYTLTVTGQTGCTASLTTQPITVTLGPVVFFVDPPAVYNGVAIRATIYASGLTEEPSSVAVTPAGGGAETPLGNVEWTMGSNTLRADIPAGLPAGDYDVFVRGVGGCDAFLANGLKVVADTVLALETPAVRPAFGLAGEPTAVTLRAKAQADLAAGETNFQATPRVYLSSATAGLATPVRSVSFVDATSLTAIIPALPAGTYDVVVVNPDATVGFAANAFRTTTIPPPLIDDVAPTQLDNDQARPVTITGQNFAPTSSMDVSLFCLAPTGTITPHTLPITTGASTATVLVATVPSGITHGSACVVRVTHSGDATFDEWSALSITNPAAKLPAFKAGEDLVQARRAPAMVAGRATREARFVYAIGGDSGATTGARDTQEVASLGRFGEIGAWRLLQNTLPRGLTLAHAQRVGRHVFLLGGHDGTSPTSDIHRATILDPEDTPEVTDLDLRFAANMNGLAAGAWTYVVTAVYAATDTENPGGESLPSEPVTLYAPAVPGGIEIELTWTTVTGTGATPATAYRVYRTEQVNGTRADLRLLAELPAAAGATQSYTDMNAALADAQKRPFELGALGTWQKLAVSLGTPRAAFGFAAATDPACAPYWYLVGGITDTATESASYDLGSLDAVTGHPTAFVTHQSQAGSFDPRREHAVVVANAQTAPALVPSGCQSYLYAAYGHAGSLAAPTKVTNARYTRVGAAGVLVSDETVPVAGKWSAAVTAPRSLAGMAAFLSSNGAYLLGGSGTAGPTSDAILARVCAAANCFPVAALENWSDAANDLTVPRYLPGMARSGAFIYLAGGANMSSVALTSTEMNLR